MKKTYGYARVSTKEQHLNRQIKALMGHGVEERDIITDKATGANLEREGYMALKRTILREGDTLVIKSLDRLSRRKTDIKTELEFFKNNHIRLMSLGEKENETRDNAHWDYRLSLHHGLCGI